MFVVDLKKVKHPKDILCDGMGAWNCNGCRSACVTVDEDGAVEFFSKSTTSTWR